MATAREVFRDYVTDGVPASGTHQVKKSEIRNWGASLDSAVAAILTTSGLVFDTRANLYADLAHGPNSLAMVVSDATISYRGIYRKSGSSGSGSWTKVRNLPQAMILATDAGAGTANAIVATSDSEVTDGDLVRLTVYRNNTGAPVTVSFNGDPALTIKTNSGSNPPANGLVAGSVVLGIPSGTEFRLLSDIASAAIQAAAEDARAGAEAALAAMALLASQAEAEAGTDNTKWMSPLRVAQAISVLGSGQLVSNVKTFGALGDNSADDTAEIQAAIDDLGSTGGIVFFPPGIYRITSLTITTPVTLLGSGEVASVLRTTSATADVIQISGIGNAPGAIIDGLGFDATVTRTAGVYIKSTASQGTTIRNFKMNGAWIGIHITGSPTVQNIVIENGQSNGTLSCGVKVDAYSSNGIGNIGIVISYIKRVLVTGALGTECPNGFLIKVAGDLTLEDLSTIYCTNGINFSPSTSGGNPDVVQAINISNSFFDTGTGHGIVMNPTSPGVVRLVRGVNIWSCSNGNGLTYAGTGQIIDTSFANSNFSGNTSNGVYLASTAAVNTAIIGCSIAGNTGSGIATIANVNSFRLIGNHIGRTDVNNLQFGANGGYGINISAGTGDKYMVVGNVIGLNTTGGIVDGGTGSARVVQDNLEAEIGSGPSLTPYAVPSVKWGVDFTAAQGAGISITNGTPYQLAAGSGEIILTDDATGTIASFLVAGGTVTKLGGNANIVSGAAGANQIGLAYNGGTGKYQVSNGYAGTRSVGVATIRTRAAS